jgi:Uncharacterized protein related to glutamine synthetase
MLEEVGVYKRREVEAIRDIRMESFCTAIEVEMALLWDMLYEGVLPAISQQMKLEKDSLSALDGVDFPEGAEWREFIRELGTIKVELLREAKGLAEAKKRIDALPIRERATAIVEDVVPMMERIRAKCDEVEGMMSADIWPYPIYRNLLSLSM